MIIAHFQNSREIFNLASLAVVIYVSIPILWIVIRFFVFFLFHFFIFLRFFTDDLIR